MNDMPAIFKKMAVGAGKNVQVLKNTQSGASFRVHSQREDMYAAIKSAKWDYVVLQGYSREFSFRPEYMDTATIPFMKQITDSIYANNPCTNILLYMTWGYEDGFKERPEVDTYDKMTDSIANGYTYAGKIFNVPVVPVGLVWKKIKSTSSIDLYAPDRAHPSINGSFLIAFTFFTAIFDESNEKVFTSTIKSDYASLIKKSTYEYVHKNRLTYNLDNNRYALKPYLTSSGAYSIDVKSSFPGASSIIWSFGDGKDMNKPSGTHTYKNYGKYVVKIEVQDQCGIRQHSQIVTYQKPEKPTQRNRKKPKYNVGIEKKI